MTLEPPVAVSWGMDCCEFLTVWGHMPSGETPRKEAVPGVLISPTMHRGGLSTAFSTLTLASPRDEFGILCHRPQQLPEYLLVPFVEMPVLSKRSCEVLAHSVGTRLWSLATGGLKPCFCFCQLAAQCGHSLHFPTYTLSSGVRAGSEEGEDLFPLLAWEKADYLYIFKIYLLIFLW